MLVRELPEETPTNITDEDDFGVSRNVLGEERLLVVQRLKFMLTGGIGFIWSSSRQVEEVEPAFCSHSYYKVLSEAENEKKTHFLGFIFCVVLMLGCCFLTFPLLQTSPTATHVSCEHG